MKLVECKTCLGTGLYFDGENMVECTRCDANHMIPEENEEDYYNEDLILDDPEFEQFDEDIHSPKDSGL